MVKQGFANLGGGGVPAWICQAVSIGPAVCPWPLGPTKPEQPGSAGSNTVSNIVRLAVYNRSVPQDAVQQVQAEGTKEL